MKWPQRANIRTAGGVDNSRKLNKVREWKNRQKEFLKEHPELKRVYANEKSFLNILNLLTDNESKALKRYISSESYKINEKLRNSHKLSKEEQRMVWDLDKALDKFPVYKGDVIRTLDIYFEEDKKEFLKSVEIGKNKKYKEFISSSYKEGYNKDAKVIIFIKSKTGKNISKYNHKESEILFKRNTEFIPIKVLEKDGITHIWLEEYDEEIS